MPLRPLNDTVIVEPDENMYVDNNPEVVRIASEGIIKLPEGNSLEKVANTGKIVSWGEKCKYSSLFNVGKRVMFKQYGGNTFYHEGQKLKTFIEEEILAIYET